MGVKLAKKLRLSQDESDIFISLVGLHQKRNKAARKQAEENLKSIQATRGYDELSLERFKIISDWYHFAILELTELPFFESDAKWIAGRLGISSKLAAEAVDRLLEFGLLKQTPAGTYVQTHSYLATPSGIPSRELREHHSQILMKADAALEEVEISERDFSAITMAVDTSQIDELRKKLKEFRRSFSKSTDSSPKKNRVYCLAIQFFPLDREKTLNRRKS